MLSKNQIIGLIYMYAFLLSFEHILEDLFNLATIFKPYRIIGILIILVTTFTNGSLLYHRDKNDKYLSMIVLYGGILTMVFYAIGESINLAGFINDFLQILFNLLVFLSIKKLDLSYRQLHKILISYTLGILVNVGMMVLNYYFSGSTPRASGFMDNPNSASIAIIVSFLFILKLVWKNGFNALKLINLFYIVLLALMTLAIFASGSRGGVILLFIGTVLFGAIALKSGYVIRFVLFGSLLFLSYNLFTTFQSQSTTKILNQVFESRFFLKLEQQEDDIRIYLWKGGLEAFKDSNFLGLGIGQFRSNVSYFHKYMSDLIPYYVRSRINDGQGGLGLHSLYIELLVEGGIVSLSLIIIYFYLVFRWCLSRLKYPDNFETHSFLFVTFVIVIFSSFVSRGMLSGLFWFAVMICSRTYQDYQNSQVKTLQVATE